MEPEIAADTPLDYVTFQILPENRYGACICSEEKEEMVGDGPLEQLLEHIPYIKDQIVQGFCDNFKLELPNSIGDSAWFTKTTLTRFLHIIGSTDALKKSIAVSNEMSQLEETRKFHLSLYTQADKSTSSDASKNELLRAMDSRMAALTEDLFSTFNLAAGAVFSVQEMIDLQGFCQHFGDVDLRNLFLKLSERSQKDQTIVSENKKKSSVPFVSKSDFVNKISGNIQILGQSNSLKPVQYNASPAKAAEFERQNSTGSDDSSISSEDDQPSAAERSRTLVRSASPRRSASPMRKVQIGRSGSRRTPALTIKSLPHFPARERISSYRDTDNDCRSEESEEPSKKTEINVTRISVQDAISLFENKQRDQTVETQKKSAIDNSTNTNKAVLRRWSSGMSESQSSITHNTMEHTVSKNDPEPEEEDAQRNAEVEFDTVPTSDNQELGETMKADMEFEVSKNIAVDLSEDDGQTEENCEKVDSAQWNRQKEEELNKMLMKFAEYNLSNPKNPELDNDKNHVSRLGQSVGLNSGHQKESKGEKVTGEKFGKRVEKQSAIRTKQRVADKPKPEKNSSAKVSDMGKKLPASRTPNLNKNPPVSSIPKKESPKPVMQKKVPSKSSTLPATRKSWPSTPSPRAVGALPTKSSIVTPPSVTSAPRQKSQSVAPRQKPQLPGPVSRPSPKLEKPQLQQKVVKKQQVDTRKSVKKVDDSKSRALPKSGKTTIIKTVMTPEEDTVAAVSPAKAAVRKKVTKKSSVVPLEVKSSARKVPSKSPAKSPASKKRETPSQMEETLLKSEDPVSDAGNIGTVTSDTIHLAVSQEMETLDGHLALEIDSETENPENGSEKEILFEAPAEGDERLLESPAKIQTQLVQESLISPAAWEESNPHDITVPIGESSISSLANPDAVAASSGTRVRHSLSQMLLEESSEPDIIEWGNAEHPPSMVYQKDAPKGLRKLLKFARKNKEANGVAWASPYASEGEDDGDEYRNLGKRNSDNLLKVALHSKNYAEGFLSDSEPPSARSNASNSSARSSSKFQEGHVSSKGARSFFSLSAFRGKN